MRDSFVNAMMRISQQDEFAFMTGDLGFNALEPLKNCRPGRFFNMGISEQAMVGAAAGMALRGFKPWVYSIAPFLYSRAHEFIRTDCCLNNAPVRLVGNGGGWTYGVMGPTHHSLEDYGTMLMLPNMKAFIPAFKSDLDPMVDRINTCANPTWLRLARDEGWNPDVPYAPWRKMRSGQGLMIVVGPLAQPILKELEKFKWKDRGPTVWVWSECSHWPEMPPREVAEDILEHGYVEFVEEHQVFGGLGHIFSGMCLHTGLKPRITFHTVKPNVDSNPQGSTDWNRKRHGLDLGYLLEVWE